VTNSQNKKFYYHTDGLGSTTAITSSTGAVVKTYQYDVFGAIRAQTGTQPNEFTFTGEQVDGSGLQYLRARYYDNVAGRFVTQDPLPLLQRYPYVGDNPVNYVDPYGLCVVCDFVNDNLVAPVQHHVVNPVVDYVSQPENIAFISQQIGSFGMVVSCGGQDAIIPVALVCVGSVVVYGGGTLGTVYLADGNYAKACHAAAAAPGFLPLSGVRGKVVSFVTGVTDEFCEPPTAYGLDSATRWTSPDGKPGKE
jgi:RHS repeat-associated protein